ncbi:DUF11 domain-containing protein [Leifsonia soli]|uniref:DUF11 domain-containing protein n=1 Tax=Leifsonia soli TaxID=582665 RepID=A0A852T2J6_9MICO|nr:DUF11 domain-containing protein [Leifsonia soli]NYD75709.1 hypothetical protein [Leifsonia soli]
MRTLLRTLLTIGVVAAVLAAAMTTAPSVRADEPAAQLSITLTNSERTVKAGDAVTYTGHVKNLGGTEAAVTIVLESPGYVDLGTAAGAKVEKHMASWTPSIAPGADHTFTIPATIGKIPATERRVTTLASVYAGEDKTPIVRTAAASFIDGVKDVPDNRAVSAQSERNTLVALPWVIGGAVVLLAIVAAVVLLLILRGRRKHRRRGTPLGYE